MNNYLINNNEPKILPANETQCKSQKNNIIEQNDREIFELPSGCLSGTILRLSCKGPTEQKFYSFSIKNRMLDNDTIATVRFSPTSDSNVTADRYSLQEQTFTVRFNGGELNKDVPLKCEVKTEKEEILDFVCILPIRAEGVLYENNDGLVVIMGATGPKGEKGDNNLNDETTDLHVKSINSSALVPTKAAPSASLFSIVNKVYETRSFNLPNRPIEITMHRGGKARIIENTVYNAVNSYRAHQEISFEFDIQSTATDGKFIIWHDNQTDRLLDHSLELRTSTYEDLKSLRFTGLKNTPYYDVVKLSSLDEWCQFIAKVNRPFYPEIKRFETIDQVTQIVKTIQSYGLSHLATFENGAYSVLEHVRSLDSKCRVGYIQFGEDNNIDSAIKKMQTLGNGVLLWQIDTVSQDPSIIQKCIDADVGLSVWTAADDHEFLKALTAGATSVTCNNYPVQAF